MKKFRICVQTTFRKWYEIKAKNEDEAEKILVDSLDDTTDTEDFDTDIVAFDEIK